ncbi:MAG: Fur family transcriptional regulator [Candidatus Aminicenantales bacterium]
MKAIKNKLQEKEIKPTYIRLRILDYLESNDRHPTAESIYDALSKEIPTISRTSVYNTLNYFHQKGLVNLLYITGSETRYDSRTSPHHHFLCEKCGRIYDLDIECVYFQEGSVQGHKIEELHGYFRGTCKECLKKEN